MIFTESFRQQHAELLEIAKKIGSMLEVQKLKENGKEVRSLLSTLAGKISVHLAAEDNSLYPKLLNHQSAEIKSLANKYIDEMGNIKEAFSAYSKKWYNPTDIENKAEEFIKDTKGIFEALGKRIERENNELYLMVDKLEQK